jgi:hypothetical protein
MKFGTEEQDNKSIRLNIMHDSESKLAVKRNPT